MPELLGGGKQADFGGREGSGVEAAREAGGCRKSRRDLKQKIRGVVG